MAETISPVVHGGKRRRYWSTLTIHTMAAMTTAGAIGAALGAAGGLVGWPSRAALGTLGAVALTLAVRDVFALPIPLPALRRQVPEWWRTFFSPPVAAGLYGAGLGVGFLTHLYTGSLVIAAVGSFVSGRADLGAVVYGAYGLARGASLLAVAHADDERTLQRVVARLEAGAASRGWRRANGIVLATTAVAAMLSAI